MQDQEVKNVSVRMPPALLDWLKSQSSASLRSLSAEVVFQLQKAQQGLTSKVPQ